MVGRAMSAFFPDRLDGTEVGRPGPRAARRRQRLRRRRRPHAARRRDRRGGRAAGLRPDRAARGGLRGPAASPAARWSSRAAPTARRRRGRRSGPGSRWSPRTARRPVSLSTRRSSTTRSAWCVRSSRGVRPEARREMPGLLSSMAVSARAMDQEAQFLSGGNQQKVVLARWLATRPRIVLMDEPTRGIDVGAKHGIYELMRTLAADGVSVLMVSSELPEVIGMSDRILVMRDGRLAGELPAGVTEEQVLALATGVDTGAGEGRHERALGPDVPADLDRHRLRGAAGRRARGRRADRHGGPQLLQRRQHPLDPHPDERARLHRHRADPGDPGRQPRPLGAVRRQPHQRAGRRGDGRRVRQRAPRCAGRAGGRRGDRSGQRGDRRRARRPRLRRHPRGRAGGQRLPRDQLPGQPRLGPGLVPVGRRAAGRPGAGLGADHVRLRRSRDPGAATQQAGPPPLRRRRQPRGRPDVRDPHLGAGRDRPRPVLGADRAGRPAAARPAQRRQPDHRLAGRLRPDVDRGGRARRDAALRRQGQRARHAGRRRDLRGARQRHGRDAGQPVPARRHPGRRDRRGRGGLRPA